jgi:membrane protease YdiL (CAAX protease family)
MSRLFSIPEKPPSFSQKVSNVLAAYAFSILWLGVFYLVLTKVGLAAHIEKLNLYLVVFNEQVKKLVPNSRLYILHVCVLAPLIEELIFRETPLRRTLNTYWTEQRKVVVTSTIFALSVIFGYLHGSVLNIFLQGVGGLVLSWVYLANNRSYLSAVITHSLYNTTLVGASALGVLPINVLM